MKEGYCCRREKGKNILDDGPLLNKQEIETGSSKSRLGIMPSKSNITFGSTNEDLSGLNEKTSCRMTGNRKGSSSGVTEAVSGIMVSTNGLNAESTSEDISWFVNDSHCRMIRNGNKPSNGLTGALDEISPFARHVHKKNMDDDQYAGNANEIDSFKIVTPVPNGSSNPIHISSSVSLDREDTMRRMKGKRKIRSGQMFQTTTGAESSILQSPVSGQPSNLLTTGPSSLGVVSVPLHSVIDVDEFSPKSQQTYTISGDSSVSGGLNEKDLQVESDELLARQLQEQLFNESLDHDYFDEIDVSIAHSLQREADDYPISSVRRRRRSQLRGSSVARRCRQLRSNSSRSSARQMPRQPHPLSRFSEIRRNLNRIPHLESRLDYLEVLEASFGDTNDMSLPNSLLHMERDFNENDYEMLLALDDENQNHAGASLHQIDSLPLSVVQTENVEENCAICLDAPTVGDTIRHLPCLHKFHKDCIDRWLRRKTLCPICKLGIT